MMGVRKGRGVWHLRPAADLPPVGQTVDLLLCGRPLGFTPWDPRSVQIEYARPERLARMLLREVHRLSCAR